MNLRPLAIAAICALSPGLAYGQAQTVSNGQYNSSTPSLSNLQNFPLKLDVNGNLKTVASGTPSGTQDVNIAKVAGATVATGHGTAAGALRVELPTDGTGLVNAAQSGAWTVQTISGTTGGASAYFVQPTASDNHAVIKNGAGTVYFATVFNNSATVNYGRLYDLGTGFNGCNSATGLITQFQIPASTSVGGFTVNFGPGIAFGTGISICVTSGYATNDTTNATASAMSVTIGYK